MRHLESWWIMIWSPSHMRTPCESSSRPFLSCLRRDLSPKPRYERWSSDVQLEHVGTIAHLVSIVMHCSDLAVPGLLLDIRNHHTSVYGIHTRTKFKIACNYHRNYMEPSQHISRSHFHMSCVQLFLISYPDPYTRAGAWPLDKLELLCCNDQGCGSNVILTLAAHQHPIQLLTGLSWTRLGECFNCVHLFAHIHDNNMTWHCCFSSSEWWMYDIWSLEVLEVCCESDLMLNDAIIGKTCLLVHRYLRIGELSTLQQSNIARSLNGIWPLGTLWRFFNWDRCTKKRFAGVDGRLQAVLSFWAKKDLRHFEEERKV